MKKPEQINKEDPNLDITASETQQCCDPSIESYSGSDRRAVPSISYNQIFGSQDVARILIGVSVASGCIPCTSHNIKKAREAGVSNEKIHKSISIALGVRECATEVMKARALEQLDDRNEYHDEVVSDNSNFCRIGMLTAISCAYALNSSVCLQKHIEAGKKLGITYQEIYMMAEIASFVRKKAKSFADRIITKSADTSSEETGQSLDCGCNSACN